jgi:hypothetical protein
MNLISKRVKRKADQALSPGSNVENESKKRRKVKNESVKHRKVKNESVKRRNNKTESAKRQNDEEVVDDEEVPMYDVIRQRNIETRERLFNELKIGEAVSDLRTSMSTPKPLRVKPK